MKVQQVHIISLKNSQPLGNKFQKTSLIKIFDLRCR